MPGKGHHGKNSRGKNPIYGREDAERWIKEMREMKWNKRQLAEKRKIPYLTLTKILTAYAYGEL